MKTVEETIKVPAMSESISEGTLKQWLKKKGDFVELDEEIATIETDKVSFILYLPLLVLFNNKYSPHFLIYLD